LAFWIWAISCARCRTKNERRRKQVAGLPLGPRIGVGQREQSAAEQGRELAGVDLVGLGLAAVDGFHVEGVAEDEGDAFVLAQVGQPVPGEPALRPDDQAVAVRLHGLQEGRGRGRQVLVEDGPSLGVEDVGVHRSGMEIDAGVVSMASGVESHGSWPPRGRAVLIPHRGWWVPIHLKLPRGDRLVRDPVLFGDRLRPVTREAIRSIQALQQTEGHESFPGLQALRYPAVAELGVRRPRRRAWA